MLHYWDRVENLKPLGPMVERFVDWMCSTTVSSSTIKLVHLVKIIKGISLCRWVTIFFSSHISTSKNHSCWSNGNVKCAQKDPGASLVSFLEFQQQRVDLCSSISHCNHLIDVWLNHTRGHRPHTNTCVIKIRVVWCRWKIHTICGKMNSAT